MRPFFHLVIARSPRDEAIQHPAAETFLDCFAALAMTEQEFIVVAPTHAQQN